MAGSPHIVDVLIAERAPRLTASRLWPLVRPLLYGILDYGQARRLADAIAPMSGREIMAHVSRLLEVRVETQGLENLPASGRAVAVCNHPTGLADGVAAFDALSPRRPDLVFFANSDALRVAPRFEDVIIPVEWVEAKRTRERTRVTLQRAQGAFDEERLLMIFPAGRIAVKDPDGRLVDPEWQSTPIALARRHQAPLVPMHLSGPPSVMFNRLDRVSRELRDVTLFHELLNKRGRSFRLVIGPPIQPAMLEGDSAVLIRRLKTYVEEVLPNRPDQPFA